MPPTCWKALSLLPLPRPNLSSSDHSASNTWSHQPLPWQEQQGDTECSHQDLQHLHHVTFAGVRLFIPRFSHIYHPCSLTKPPLFQMCWDTVEFPEHFYFWLISQLKDKSCSRGDCEVPISVHGGAGAEGSEPAGAGGAQGTALSSDSPTCPVPPP